MKNSAEKEFRPYTISLFSFWCLVALCLQLRYLRRQVLFEDPIFPDRTLGFRPIFLLSGFFSQLSISARKQCKFSRPNSTCLQNCEAQLPQLQNDHISSKVVGFFKLFWQKNHDDRKIL